MTSEEFRRWYARLVASVFRVRTFRRAQRLFAAATPPAIVERKFCGYRLTLDVSRSSAHRLLYLEGERFVPEQMVLRRLLFPGARVIDVGANIGYYTLLFARQVAPGGSILAIEPEPRNLEELRRNIEMNKLENVTVLPIALGRHDGRVTVEAGMNGRVGPLIDGGGGVEIRRLDEIIDGPVDFIKVDVEGYESEVLAGASETLRRWMPALFVEVHPQMLVAGSTVRSIFDSLATYSMRRVFRPTPRLPLWRSLIGRYLPGQALREVQEVSDWVDRCDRGVVLDPFWLICTGDLQSRLGRQRKC